MLPFESALRVGIQVRQNARTRGTTSTLPQEEQDKHGDQEHYQNGQRRSERRVLACRCSHIAEISRPMRLDSDRGEIEHRCGDVGDICDQRDVFARQQLREVGDLDLLLEEPEWCTDGNGRGAAQADVATVGDTEGDGRRTTERVH